MEVHINCDVWTEEGDKIFFTSNPMKTITDSLESLLPGEIYEKYYPQYEITAYALNNIRWEHLQIAIVAFLRKNLRW